MKNILRGAVAALAIVSTTGTAMAATHSTTNERHYAVDLSAFGGPVLRDTNPSAATAKFYDSLLPLGNLLGLGTRYTASTTAADDTETASPVVSNAFTLTGKVNRDCSFYAGNKASARNIDFGTIGVRTGDAENVNSAFEMAGALNANIETLTAGCNTNNTVTIAKDDLRGLVNQNPGGYDTNQFQANIPYSVNATWTGVALNAQTTGTGQTLNVPGNSDQASLQQGAWRSSMNIAINAPVQPLALVAGDYKGTMTVTLTAL